MLTVYSINIPKRHRKMFGFFCKLSVFLARKVSPLRVEGITDLPAVNTLCFLPFSLLSPVTQKYQGIWHCLIPLPGRSRPSRFHSCSSATPETAGERCLPSPAALVIPSPSLTRAFGSFERQACEVRYAKNSFWDFHSGREGFRRLPGSNPAVRRKHSNPASFQQHRTEAPYPGAKSLRASDSHQAGIYPYNKKAATEVTALNMHLFALLYLAKPMARRSRMTVTRIWPG